MDKNPSTVTVKTPSSNFTGDVWMNTVFSGDGTSQLTCGFVRFTPGAHQLAQPRQRAAACLH